MKEIFEDYYAADANAPSGGGEGDDAGEPADDPKPKANDDDMLS
jgi:hypothetical protein